MTIERLPPDANLEPVLEIERASFSVPWTEDMFRQELDNPNLAAIWVTKDAGGLVVAFCCVWTVLEELHVNNVAVRPEHRGRGLATQLLEYVMAAAAGRGAERVTLEVRRSNLAALNLYQKLGFRVGGVRRNYYSEPVEDALILWRTVAPDPSVRPTSAS